MSTTAGEGGNRPAVLATSGIPGYPPAVLVYPGLPVCKGKYADFENETGHGTAGVSVGEDGKTLAAFEFTEKSIRIGFLRKVYAILMCQLLVTVAIIAVFTYHQPTKLWVQDRPELIKVAFWLNIFTMIFMACCESMRRRFPTNFIFFSIYTLTMSFLLGCVASRYDSIAVISAVGMTAVVCFAVTMFALQTKWDFTPCGGILLCALVILLTAGIIALYGPHGKQFHVLYASLGALVFSCLLIFDTQLMLGGEHKYSISPEEYLFAALTIYLDVINIFLCILRLR